MGGMILNEEKSKFIVDWERVAYNNGANPAENVD